MTWTAWRKLADNDGWYDDKIDWERPACYELATGDADGGSIESHYVGETVNERSRMLDYARHGSHLSDIIDDHVGRGWWADDATMVDADALFHSRAEEYCRTRPRFIFEQSP